MRVVAGERKGTALKALEGTTTRPTTDKVKESIFNIIGPFFDGGIVVDLFAGTGGLGIEALSRGAQQAIFIEKDRRAFQILQQNIQKCRYEEKAELFHIDATRAVKALMKREFQIDYLFVDPPYFKEGYYDFVDVLVANNKISKSGLILCEHAKEVQLPSYYGPFTCVRSEIYGSIVISIYRHNEEEGK